MELKKTLINLLCIGGGILVFLSLVAFGSAIAYSKYYMKRYLVPSIIMFAFGVVFLLWAYIEYTFPNSFLTYFIPVFLVLVILVNKFIIGYSFEDKF